MDLCKKTVQFIETLCKGDIVVGDIKQQRSIFTITKFPTSPLYIVRRTLLTASVSNSLQIHALVTELSHYGPKCEFQYGDCHHLGFCRPRVLSVKIVPRPHFQSLCQIWFESVQKWQSYSHLTDFKMAAVHHLGFWRLWILMANVAPGPCFQPLHQIQWKYVRYWPSYGPKCELQYGGRRQLNLLPVFIFIIWSSLCSGYGCYCKIS